MRFLYIALFSAAALVSSCEDPGSSAAPNDPASAPDASLLTTGRIHMRALESGSSSGRQLQLFFQDEGNYPCANYRLNTTYKQENKQVKLTFTGVTKPSGICLTAIGPARSAVDVSTLPIGKYQLLFAVGARSTSGTLEIQDTQLKLSSNDPSLVEVLTPEIRFMPKNIIWGYATTMLPQAQASVEVLRDSLQRLGATPTTLPAGVYSQFTIAANGLPQLPQVSVGARALLLLANYSGSAERIQAYVKRANAATPGLNLWINTSGI